MGKYIDRLMMCGFNVIQVNNIVRSFERELDFEGLERFVGMMEDDRRCRNCPYGKNTITILVVEEESGIVPSER